MRVFKFGGASIATPERATALLPIIKNETEPVVIVISALGKTTNALELILHDACAGMKDVAQYGAGKLKKQHLSYAEAILNKGVYSDTEQQLSTYFAQLDNAIQYAEANAYDYSYDQVVCMGEVFSTIIVAAYLQQHGIPLQWVDARTVVRTDNTFRDAVVDWEHSAHQAQMVIGAQLSAGKSVVTQGFIGATANGESVTLGREGSDYTAGILAAMLKLESVTIWKDVEGLKNADPKIFPDTVKIDAINYNEVIEMAFYGAQIIHPKTIKPLQNNDIPLYVKCFLDPALPGTVIQKNVDDAHYPPLIVLKENQVLVQVTTRDFSFITEDNLSNIYAIFHELKVKINLIQNAAISFIACIDNRADKIRPLTEALGKDYKVLLNEDVSLLTIRHFNPEIVNKLTDGKQILLKQETRKTLQTVMM